METNGTELVKVNAEDIDSYGTFTFPKEITTIGCNAFANCLQLSNIVIPKQIIAVNHSAFFGCSELHSVVFENEYCEIDICAFLGCEKLEHIILPKRLSASMFAECFWLREIDIPNTVNGIGLCPFEFCVNLNKINWRGHRYTYNDLLEYVSFFNSSGFYGGIYM